jgi:hypothetical protein
LRRRKALSVEAVMVIMSSARLVDPSAQELPGIGERRRFSLRAVFTQLRRRAVDTLGMSLDPFRSRPSSHSHSFMMSRRLERTALMISFVISAVGVAIFWLSVGGALFSSPLTLFAVEGVVVLAQVSLLAVATFLRRRGLG